MKNPRNIAWVAGVTVVLVGLTAAAAVSLGIVPVDGAPRASAALNLGTDTGSTSNSATVAKAAATADLADEATVQADTEDARYANKLLGNLAKTYEHLDDVTVIMGTTPKGEEAVSYYMDGEIVISTAHTVGIDEILAHEVWHVIDWRDNGRIDWGEDLPPSNSSDYLK